MDGENGANELLDHIERTTRLSRGEAARLVAEVLAYFSDSVAEYVTRRHAQLQAEQRKNPLIFETIAAELQTRRFAAPPLTQRQIRRLIYG